MARVAVGIAAGDDADTRRTLRLEGAAVTDASAGWYVLHGEDLAAQGHHRLQSETLGARVGKRAGAVKHDARPHPVVRGLRVTQDRRRIGHRHRVVHARGHLRKAFELPVDPACAVGLGEMHHQRDRPDAFGVLQFAAQRRHLLQREAEAVHAGIQFDVDRQAHRQGGFADHPELLDPVDRRRQPVFGAGRQVSRFKEAFEQQDRLPKPCFTQGDRRIHLEQRKTVGYFIQRSGHAQETVPVGIRLDHRPGLRRIPAARGVLFGDRIVVTDCGEVDSGLCRAGHGCFRG